MNWTEKQEEEKELYVQSLLAVKATREHPFYILARKIRAEYAKSPMGREYSRKYRSNRRKTDINFRIRCQLSASLRNILKVRGFFKSAKTSN